MLVLHDEFKEKLIQITNLSKKINENHKEKIFEMINEHIQEIQELYNENNEHWAVETADLIVLCYELMISESINIDLIFSKALPRFDKKLTKLSEGVDL